MMAASALALLAAPAMAQDAGNLEKMQSMKTTHASLEGTFVEQKGATADQLRENLKSIELPKGFKIDLYAVVPDARHMAVAPQGTVVFVGTRKDKVWSVSDRDRDRVADEVKEFVPTLDLAVPNGVCFSKDGILYLAEQNRVLAFPAAEFFYEGADVAVGTVVPQGELIPPDEESYNHTARVCRVGPDGKLYVALGQPYNVPPPEKLDLYKEKGIGGIVRMNTDGTDREVYATGIRNSVGIEFNPADGSLWFTDNQVDGMGDDIPPGEINRATEAGQNFGFPWYGGGDVRTNEYKDQEPPADTVMPQAKMVAHAADLGLDIYEGKMFPDEYKGGIFSAQHGSWNRTTPVGARVMFTPINEDGTAGEPKPFAEGWLDQETGEYAGRPVDVAELKDGSLLVSDDYAGAIYRISYQK
ncbi:MAG: PQQ-dependent sugar dehydrogenase [Geminicoccaceae bacterium]|nr:PQQ-dependent sugar dehydrogenase [Geminicoccaceae bacterium]